MKFTIEDLKIPSNNTYYRNVGHRVLISKNGRQFKKDFQSLCIAKGIKQIKGKVDVDIKFYFKDKRKRDIDNYFKGLLDSMKDFVIEDDSEIIKLSGEKIIGYGKNIIEVEIKKRAD